MSRFYARFPFLPGAQRIVERAGIGVDEIPGDLLRAAEQRFAAVVQKRRDYSLFRDPEREILVYPVLRLMASVSPAYSDMLARFYADRTVFFTSMEGMADFFVEAGLYVDPARPVFPLPRYMSFPHIYPETKIYHLPVSGGRVYVPPERLPYVAGCIAFHMVRRGLPVEGKIPESVKEAVSRVISRAIRPRKKEGRGKGIAFIERIIAASGIPDGRKRILLYWLIPYWITIQGLSVDEAVERAKEWISRQAGGKILESWIRSDAQNVKKRGIRPWSLAKVEKESPDLVKMLREMGVL